MLILKIGCIQTKGQAWYWTKWENVDLLLSVKNGSGRMVDEDEEEDFQERVRETNFTLGPTSKTNQFPLLFLVIVVQNSQHKRAQITIQ